jgi:hypothetical protein
MGIICVCRREFCRWQAGFLRAIGTARFSHIRGESESLADYFFATKPEFTPEGVECKCTTHILLGNSLRFFFMFISTCAAV